MKIPMLRNRTPRPIKTDKKNNTAPKSANRATLKGGTRHFAILPSWSPSSRGRGAGQGMLRSMRTRWRVAIREVLYQNPYSMAPTVWTTPPTLPTIFDDCVLHATTSHSNVKFRSRGHFFLFWTCADGISCFTVDLTGWLASERCLRWPLSTCEWWLIC